MHDYLLISRSGWKWARKHPGRGRPKSIDDMRSYKAQKQREYRAKLKPST